MNIAVFLLLTLTPVLAVPSPRDVCMPEQVTMEVESSMTTRSKSVISSTQTKYLDYNLERQAREDKDGTRVMIDYKTRMWYKMSPGGVSCESDSIGNIGMALPRCLPDNAVSDGKKTVRNLTGNQYTVMSHHGVFVSQTWGVAHGMHVVLQTNYTARGANFLTTFSEWKDSVVASKLATPTDCTPRKH